MDIIQAIVLAIVEGITEFLPISSTGHMILVATMMGIGNDEFTKTFEVFIQLGAILSVVVLYFKRFFQNINFYIKLLVAFIPTAVIGLLARPLIKQFMGSELIVATSLLIGGVVLIFIDKLLKNGWKGMDNLSLQNCIGIGLFQALSMIPGVSRSAATIIGGQTQGMSRKTAAEFSFFLAVPTMAAASGLEFLDVYQNITTDNVMILGVGFVTAFIVAMAAIKLFIDFLTKHGFFVFGVYRIVIGLAIIGLYLAGYNLSSL